MTDRQKALFALVIGSLLGAANSPVIKFGLFTIPPLSFAFIRFFIAALIILPFVFNKKKILLSELRALFPMTLFATTNIIVFALGIKLTTATIGQLIYSAVPFLTGIIAYKFLDEKLRPQKFIGIIVGFAGIAIIILLPLIERGNSFSGNLLGNLLIGVGAVSWSIYLALSKQAQKTHSPYVINNAFIFVTTIVLFPLFIFDQISNPSWWNSAALSGVTALIYVATAGTIGTYLFNQYVIKHGGSVFASMSLYLLPITAFLVAFILLGERLTPGIVIGGTIALFGIFLVTSSKR